MLPKHAACIHARIARTYVTTIVLEKSPSVAKQPLLICMLLQCASYLFDGVNPFITCYSFVTPFAWAGLCTHFYPPETSVGVQYVVQQSCMYCLGVGVLYRGQSLNEDPAVLVCGLVYNFVRMRTFETDTILQCVLM